MNPTLYGDIVDSTKALIFFGTPHQGANIAAWATFLSHVSKAVGVRSSAVTEDLQAWSKPLIDLNKLFSEKITQLDVTTFFELEDTYGVKVCVQHVHLHQLFLSDCS